MRLRKVISGGQSGGDRTGLECARELKLETGGTAPYRYRTEYGEDWSLKDLGLVQSTSSSYPPRTRANVRDSDVTLWFGTTGSPGFKCTARAASDFNKPIIINPTNLQQIAEDFEVINVAGNRSSTNPSVIKQVKDAFATLKT